LPKPHGERLIDRTVKGPKKKKLLEEARVLPRLDVSPDIVQEIENIGNGVFSPLDGFMSSQDLQAVLDDMRLSSDVPWTIPIVLSQDARAIKDKGLEEGISVALFDGRDGRLAGLLDIEDIYKYDRKSFAKKVYGTTDTGHPGVRKVMEMGDRLLGGKVTLVSEAATPFSDHYLRPKETRVLFKELGWRTVVGFQTRNPPHIGHEYVQKTALTFVDGLFINPVIGKKKPGDFRDEVIIATYEELMQRYYLKDRAVMSILNFEMRYGGPKEAIFHALVRKNFGCTHFIVGRDHAGVGNYYPPFAAQEIFDDFPDLGIAPLFFKAFFHCSRCGGPVNEKVCPHQADKDAVLQYSGTKIREMLVAGKRPDERMMRAEVADVILKWKDPFVH